MAKAKLVKKKRRLRVERIASALFTLAIIIYFGAKFGLQSYNITLQKQAQATENKAATLKDSVANLESEVNTLQSRDRVLSYAEKEGIKTNQDNVAVVKGDDKK